MGSDPWEILGVKRDAAPEEIDAAYRRLAALFHPDHLEGQRPEVREEGSKRFREARDAWEQMRSARPAPPQSRQRKAQSRPRRAIPDFDRLSPGAYNVCVRGLDPSCLYATWPGVHAAAVYEALRHAHTPEGPVRQVEWGAYECTLPGGALRSLLRMALADSPRDWRREPLENLQIEPRRPYRPAGGIPPDLGELDHLVEDGARYLVTAEVFEGW